MRSLRMQLVAALALVAGLGLGAMLLLTGSQMTRMAMDAFTSRQQFVTLAIASSLSETLGGRVGGRIDTATFQQIIASSGEQLGVDLTVTDPTGAVLATTNDQITSLSTNLPEFAAALRQQVASSVRDNHFYAAAPVIHDNRDLVGVVYVDAALAPLLAELWQRWFLLVGATIAVLAIACATGWWLSGRIVRPLAAIQSAAQKMAGGQLNVRASVAPSSMEVMALGAAFNEMAERVEKMMQRQQEFVANASHELRAPLAAIKLRTEALVDGSAGGARAVQYTEEIDQEVTQLANLVTELLTLSRLDSVSFVAPSEAIDIGYELNNCIRTVRPHIEARQQQFTAAITPAIPFLFLQPSDLRLMVNNLLDNAVKYTPAGGAIQLAAGWENSLLVIEVCDDGEGIPGEDLPRVTERFFRVDRSRHTPGTGLGLTLVEAVAEQYGGQLTITSAGAGQGTCARLILRPKAAPSESAAQARGASRSSTG